MKGKILLIAALAACLAMAGAASAHLFGPNGEGNPFFAPAVPDELIPTYDGDLSDWAWFPPASRDTNSCSIPQFHTRHTTAEHASPLKPTTV